MRDYAKTGGKIGRPGYRTPSMFRNKVYAVVAKIPKGKVLSYQEVARRAGNPQAARAVGNIMHNNPDTQKVPCHRVVKSNGTVGGYAYGVRRKIAILKKEGVRIENDKIVGW